MIRSCLVLWFGSLLVRWPHQGLERSPFLRHNGNPIDAHIAGSHFKWLRLKWPQFAREAEKKQAETAQPMFVGAFSEAYSLRDSTFDRPGVTFMDGQLNKSSADA